MVAALPDRIDDASLVRAVQDGEPEAFAELFRRHYPDVRRLCASRLADPDEADEVAQAALVRAYERIEQCGGDRRFGAWVTVIADRLCIDTVRARSRRRIRPEPLAEDDVVTRFGPEEALLRIEDASEIESVLATLPLRQRQVVVARDLEGHRPIEIAAALGVSIGAVDSLLLRARRRLALAFRAVPNESGVTNFSAAVTATTLSGAGVTATRPARIVDAISEAGRVVSFHIAAAAGVVPGAPGMATRAATVFVAVASLVVPAALTPEAPPLVPALPGTDVVVLPMPALPDVASVLAPTSGAQPLPTPSLSDVDLSSVAIPPITGSTGTLTGVVSAVLPLSTISSLVEAVLDVRVGGLAVGDLTRDGPERPAR